MKACAAMIIEMAAKGADLAQAPPHFPACPEPGRDGGVKPDTVPTFAYNWCGSPLTPMAVAGVVWVPGEFNIGHTPAESTFQGFIRDRYPQRGGAAASTQSRSSTRHRRRQSSPPASRPTAAASLTDS